MHEKNRQYITWNKHIFCVTTSLRRLVDDNHSFMWLNVSFVRHACFVFEATKTKYTLYQYSSFYKLQINDRSYDFCFFKTQTEDDSDKFSGFADDNSGHLAEFLRRVEPAMHKQLEMNVKSHAFDGMLGSSS